MSLSYDHPCTVLTFELLLYPFFHQRLNFPFWSFLKIKSHSTCLWQMPVCLAWLCYCWEQSCSLLSQLLVPLPLHRDHSYSFVLLREEQIWLHFRSVSFTLTFAFYCFCFMLRMLPIVWNIQDNPFSDLSRYNTFHSYRCKMLQNLE